MYVSKNKAIRNSPTYRYAIKYFALSCLIPEKVVKLLYYVLWFVYNPVVLYFFAQFLYVRANVCVHPFVHFCISICISIMKKVLTMFMFCNCEQVPPWVRIPLFENECIIIFVLNFMVYFKFHTITAGC